MKNRIDRIAGLFLVLGLVACGSEGDDEPSSTNSGGAGTTGGTASTGGNTDSGGGNHLGGEANLGGGNQSGGAGVGGTENSGGTSSGGGANTGGTTGTRAHCKRGVAYGYHSVADMTALSSGVSWWYNWAFLPDEGVRGGDYLTLDMEYAPMIWGANSDRTAAASNIPDDAQALLGFNEPNFGSQANMSAAEAAALWPELETIADARGLKLVSPAVNYCGGNCQDTDPFNYLDEFFAACTNCRVDAVAFHIYVGCNASGNNHAEWLINHVETYKNRFDKPLWLTEFACDDPSNEAEQIAFLEDALTYLENEPRIERYAWFAGRADNMSHVDLLGADGELTALGQVYVNAAQAEGCAR